MIRLKELESIKTKLDEVCGVIDHQIELEKIQLVQEAQAPSYSHWAFSPYHVCAKSPTGACVYNKDLDPAHDDCIFCGEPEDRG